MPALRDSGQATRPGAWDGAKNRRRTKTKESESYYRKMFAWREPDSNGDKNDYRFIHHYISTNGTPGKPSEEACRLGISILNGALAGTTIPKSDRKGVYNHLARHLKSAGITPPPLKEAMNSKLATFSSLNQKEGLFEIGLRLVKKQNEMILSSISADGSQVEDGILHIGFVREGSLDAVSAAITTVSEKFSPISGNNEDIVMIKNSENKLLSYSAKIGSAEVDEIKSEIIHAISGITKVDTTFSGYMPISLTSVSDINKVHQAFKQNLVFDSIVIKSEDGETLSEYPLKNAIDSPYFMVKGFGECDGFAIVETSSSEVVRCLESESEANDEYEKMLEELMTDQATSLLKEDKSLSVVIESVFSSGDSVEELSKIEITIEDDSSESEDDDYVHKSEDDYAEVELAEEIEIQPASLVEFRGPLVFSGVETGDRRFISPGSLSFASFPMPLLYINRNTPGHSESVVCGSITGIDVYHLDDLGGDVYVGSGFFHDTWEGQDASRMVGAEYLNGVSVDLDSITAVDLESGSVVDNGCVTVITRGRIRGATLVPFPAFEQAKIYVEYFSINNSEIVKSAMSQNKPGTFLPMRVPGILNKIVEQKQITLTEASILAESFSDADEATYKYLGGEEVLNSLYEAFPSLSTPKETLSVYTEILKENE